MATKTLTQVFSEIADAIRAKTESSETFTPEEMAAAIEAIQGGLWNSDNGNYYLASGLVKELPERLSGGHYFQLNDPSQPLAILYNKVIIDGAGASEGVYYSASAEVRDKIEYGIIKEGQWLQDTGIYNYSDSESIEKLSNMVYDLDNSGNMRGSQQLTANNLYIFDPGFSTGSSFRPANNVVIDDGDVADKGVYVWDKDSEYIEKLASGYYQVNASYGSATPLDLEEAHIYQYSGSSGLMPFNGAANYGEKADDGVYVFTEDSLSLVSPGIYEVYSDSVKELSIPDGAMTYSTMSGFVSFNGFAIEGEIQDGVAYDGSIAEPGVYKWNVEADEKIEKLVDAVIYDGEYVDPVDQSTWLLSSAGGLSRIRNKAVVEDGVKADTGVYAWHSNSNECQQLESHQAYMIGDAGGISLIEEGCYSIGSGVAIRLQEAIIDDGGQIDSSYANGAVYGFNADDQLTTFAEEGYLQIQEGVAPHYVTPPTGGVDLVEGAYLISQAGTYTNANMPSPKTVEYNKYYYGNLTELPYNFVIAGGNKADAGTMYWNGSGYELTRFENPGYLYLDGTGKMPSYVTPKEGITLETGIYGVQQTGTFTDNNPPTKLDDLQDSYAYAYNQGAFTALYSCFIDSNGQPNASVEGPTALTIDSNGNLDSEVVNGIISGGILVEGLYWFYSDALVKVDGPFIEYDGENQPHAIDNAVIYEGTTGESGVYEWVDGSIAKVEQGIIQDGYLADSGVYEFNPAGLRHLEPGLYYVSYDFASQIVMDAYTLVYSVGGEFTSVKAQDIVNEPFYLQYSSEGPRYKVLVTLDE